MITLIFKRHQVGQIIVQRIPILVVDHIFILQWEDQIRNGNQDHRPGISEL
jgi:hypothetical protein